MSLLPSHTHTHPGCSVTRGFLQREALEMSNQTTTVTKSLSTTTETNPMAAPPGPSAAAAATAAAAAAAAAAQKVRKALPSTSDDKVLYF